MKALIDRCLIVPNIKNFRKCLILINKKKILPSKDFLRYSNFLENSEFLELWNILGKNRNFGEFLGRESMIATALIHFTDTTFNAHFVFPSSPIVPSGPLLPR